MNLFEIIERDAEIILHELKGRCEHLKSTFGYNSHKHLDPIVSALQEHVDAKAPVQPANPAPEVVAPVEPAPAPAVAAAAPAEAAPVVAEAAPVAVTPTDLSTAQIISL